jgi:hypothetical protein
MSLSEQAATASGYASDIEYDIAGEHYMAALRHTRLLAETFTTLAGDIAQIAYDEGATKKAIANALGVPPSMFRGMERRVTA